MNDLEKIIVMSIQSGISISRGNTSIKILKSENQLDCNDFSITIDGNEVISKTGNNVYFTVHKGSLAERKRINFVLEYLRFKTRLSTLNKEITYITDNGIFFKVEIGKKYKVEI